MTKFEVIATGQIIEAQASETKVVTANGDEYAKAEVRAVSLTTATVDIMGRINAARAAPLTHKVMTVYADAKVREHFTRSAATAENWAIGERRKIGAKLIDRETGKTVEIVAVLIEKLA